MGVYDSDKMTDNLTLLCGLRGKSDCRSPGREWYAWDSRFVLAKAASEVNDAVAEHAAEEQVVAADSETQRLMLPFEWHMCALQKEHSEAHDFQVQWQPHDYFMQTMVIPNATL